MTGGELTLLHCHKAALLLLLLLLLLEESPSGDGCLLMHSGSCMPRGFRSCKLCMSRGVRCSMHS